MKPTVGLTRFFGLMNLCEKKWVAANVGRDFVLLKKAWVFGGGKKTFFPTSKMGRFLSHPIPIHESREWKF